MKQRNQSYRPNKWQNSYQNDIVFDSLIHVKSRYQKAYNPSYKNK